MGAHVAAVTCSNPETPVPLQLARLEREFHEFGDPCIRCTNGVVDNTRHGTAVCSANKAEHVRDNRVNKLVGTNANCRMQSGKP